ncbi:VIR protein [Plasmodium vivax]|uniref:VIR protein n=1 Tax=Plasmodium vivax TaxID=5855 RepID=A0A1G4E6F0_PLAVI|nr:VIR protein [Plasmodium vivax]
MIWGSRQKWEEFERWTKLFSSELYSEKFYKQLDDLRHFREYFPVCDSLKSYDKGEGVKKLCARLLKYLKTNNISKEDNEYNICILLNYWVYDKLNVILKSDDSSSIYRAFGEIGLIWSNFIEKNLKNVENLTCKHISNIVNHDDWKKRKELYDYCVNYDALNKIVANFPQKCNDFHEYIEDKAHLYEHFKKNCPSSNENECPNFYEKCKKYDPKDALPLLRCHEEIIRKRPATVLRPPITDERVSGEETHEYFSSAGMRSSNAQNLPENSYAVRKFGDVFLGVVATTMTAGGLYKFTPLGGILRNGFGWNNNMRTFNGGDNGLFDYAPESFNPYSGGTEEHYIGYHQA